MFKLIKFLIIGVVALNIIARNAYGVLAHFIPEKEESFRQIYFKGEALGWVLIFFTLYLLFDWLQNQHKSYWNLKVVCEASLILCIGNAADEFLFDPLKFGVNEYIALAIAVLWVTHLRKFLVFIYIKLFR